MADRPILRPRTPVMYQLAQERMRDAILNWLRSSPRKPPELAFTAGPERELADEIEAAIQREKVEEEAGR